MNWYMQVEKDAAAARQREREGAMKPMSTNRNPYGQTEQERALDEARQVARDLRRSGYDYELNEDDENDTPEDAILRRVASDPTEREHFLRTLRERGVNLDAVQREAESQQKMQVRAERIGQISRATGIDLAGDPEIAGAIARNDVDEAEGLTQLRALEQAGPEQAAELVDAFSQVNRRTIKQTEAEAEDGEDMIGAPSPDETATPMVTTEKSMDEMTPEEMAEEIDRRADIEHGPSQW